MVGCMRPSKNSFHSSANTNDNKSLYSLIEIDASNITTIYLPASVLGEYQNTVVKTHSLNSNKIYIIMKKTGEDHGHPPTRHSITIDKMQHWLWAVYKINTSEMCVRTVGNFSYIEGYWYAEFIEIKRPVNMTIKFYDDIKDTPFVVDNEHTRITKQEYKAKIKDWICCDEIPIDMKNYQ
jgi:hypothetical protein